MSTPDAPAKDGAQAATSAKSDPLAYYAQDQVKKAEKVNAEITGSSGLFRPRLLHTPLAWLIRREEAKIITFSLEHLIETRVVLLRSIERPVPKCANTVHGTQSPSFNMLI